MAALKFHKLLNAPACCLFLVSAGCSAGNLVKSSNVVIDNSIEECFQIKSVGKLVHNNVILLDTKLSTVKSVGYCGCKSAVLSHYVTTHPVESGNQTREHGVFSSLQQGNYTFVLDRNNASHNKSYTLNIQCSTPD